MGCEVFHALKKVLKEKGLSTAVGDEGGFALQARQRRRGAGRHRARREKRGLQSSARTFSLALDVAASELYVADKKRYVFKKSDGRVLTGDELVAFLGKALTAKVSDHLDRGRLRRGRLGDVEKA